MGKAEEITTRQPTVVHLPVEEARGAIVRMIRRHNAVVIVGETGSGKTTRIPQYVWDDLVAQAPPGQQGIVGCTQPRRVAAVSIARHVAEQRGGRVGGEVAYAVRFDDTCSSQTRIKYMTDGILLREIQADPELSRYRCLLLDEAHERTLHGDVLFGLLKDIVRRRKKVLNIVVMSATLNAEHFSKFWWNAPIGVVHGRSYPVTIFHTVEPQADYVEAAVSTLLQIHEKEETGDVLCFLTGQEEIEDAKRILERRMKLMPSTLQDLTVLTLYSAMPYEQQLRVFEPSLPCKRRVILATNIAETSITVDGIKYVVDSGVVKAKYFSSKTGMELLSEVDVSRAQATQRTGRAGRMTAGKCFRLYTAQAFESLAENTVPEIQRSSLVSVVLQMKSLRIDRIMDFEFMDAPDPKSVAKAEETLMLLGALDRHGRITRLGQRLIDFPIEPMAAIVLLAGKAMGVERDVTVAVAMTCTENLFVTSREAKDGADRCKAAFAKSAGDHATLLSIYYAYKRVPKEQRRMWCESNALNPSQMLKAEDVMTQLEAILNEHSDEALLSTLLRSLPHAGDKDATFQRKRRRDGATAVAKEDGACELPNGHTSSTAKLRDFELLRRALCYGLSLNAAFFNAEIGNYQTVVGQQVVHLHPSSVLFAQRRKPALVVFNSVVRTTRQYMKDVSVVQEDWLRDAASFLRPVH
ncbi:putative RNA helicase [Trypanosoma conorhini]|uniref:RNA helicase n=1 Tax=Trypanosoma conorhini TaxID=83891 RepID=A0A3R7L6M7_9TRYP|nr:putative RNA helicase [Trypanosoma conorhini]RNF20846.1 putative RNA helicase [Trypanosoma conorhini]